jgi:hypothetical protein
VLYHRGARWILTLTSNVRAMTYHNVFFDP